MKRYTNRVDRTISKPRFEVLLGLQNNQTVTEISRIRKTFRGATYKIITALEEKGYLENIGGQNPKVYNITRKGIEGIHSFVALKHKLRQHNLSFKIEVLDSPRNWDKKRQNLVRLPYYNKNIEFSKNNTQQLFSFQKLEIKTTTRSVIIKLPHIYAKTIEKAVIQSMDMLYDSIPKIEKLFKIKLVKDYKANITIISQEYARLQDAIAKTYRVEGKKLYVKNAEGKIWLVADYSFKTDELETVLPNSADEDMDPVHNHLNDLRENRPRQLSVIDNDLEAAKRLLVSSTKEIVNLKGVFPVMKEYNRNLKLHTTVNEDNKRLLGENIELSRINQNLSREQLETNKQIQKVLVLMEKKLK